MLDWVDRLVQQQQVRMLSLARRRGLSPDDAFDAVQDAFCTFLRLPAARTLSDRPDDAARLLARIMANATRAERRRRRTAEHRTDDAVVTDDVPHHGESPADVALAQQETHSALQRCIASLDDLQRAVVTLRMLDESSGQCVAAALGITPGHVAVVLHRAKAQLRGCMDAAGHCAGDHPGCAKDEDNDATGE